MSIANRRMQRAVRGSSSTLLTLSNIQAITSAGAVTISWDTSIPADGVASLFFGPAKHCTWNWQLSGTVDTSADAQVYDFDAFDNTVSLVSQLHSQSIYCIAYFSGGTWENWRDDAGSFPSDVLGNNVSGWAGEKWLDIRQLSVLRPVMEARADIAKSKGFNAIEWDNVDGYLNSPGFPITQLDQQTYNKMLAQIAHIRGLASFLKNDIDDVAALQPYFEGSIAEQPYQYNEAAGYQPFATANKPVLVCEYQVPSAANITDASNRGYSLIRHQINLDTKYLTSYVVGAPAPVVLTNLQSPKQGALSSMSQSLTFTGLTSGQVYGYIIRASSGAQEVYDGIPRSFIAV